MTMCHFILFAITLTSLVNIVLGQNVKCKFDDSYLSNGICFRYNNSTDYDWAEAKASCESWGGALAMFTDKSQILDVINFFNIPPESSIYFGANDVDFDGTWTWVHDKQPIPPTCDFWIDDTPSVGQEVYTCGQIHTSKPLGGISYYCTETWPFMCMELPLKAAYNGKCGNTTTDETTGIPKTTINELTTTIPTTTRNELTTTINELTTTINELSTTIPKATWNDLTTTIPTTTRNELTTTIPTTTRDELTTTIPSTTRNELTTTINELSTTIPTTTWNELTTTITTSGNERTTTIPTYTRNEVTNTINEMTTTIPTTIWNELTTTFPKTTRNELTTTIQATTRNELTTTIPTTTKKELTSTIPTTSVPTATVTCELTHIAVSALTNCCQRIERNKNKTVVP